MLLLPSLILLISLAGLTLSARYVVQALSNVTKAFGISEYTTAFIILALATSMPEVSVAISSALQNASGVLLATAFGSNIVNITLVLGLTAMFSGGIATDGLHLRRDIYVAGIVSALPILFVLNGVISRVEGALLIGVFTLYIAILIRDHIKTNGLIPKTKHIAWGVVNIVLALLLIAILLFAASKVVSSAVELATLVGIPAFLIGLFLLSAGTSLPELVTSLHSNRVGKSGMSFGNIIGSNVANSALVIGIAAIIRPIATPLHPSLIATMASVIIATAIMGYFAATRQSLSVFDGLKLLIGFFVFGIVIFFSGAASI